MSDIDWVEKLHGIVDELVAPLVLAHGARLTCHNGCHACCSDALSVFAIEAQLITQHHAELLETGLAHEAGGCAFLDPAGGCRIYAQRPYVCRTQGLPLRWLERGDDGQPVELRDICPKNAEGPALETLSADVCWTLGAVEQRLAARQTAADGGVGQRVALRSLFAGARRHLPLAE